MQTRGLIQGVIRLWILSTVCLCMASCHIIWSEESLNPHCEEKVRQTVTLNLAISHPDAFISTKADLEYDDLTFSTNEAAVKSLTAFIVDLNPDGSENYDGIKYFSTDIDPIDFNNGIYIMSRTLEVETGSKHIYVGANLKEEHIQAFIRNKPLSLEREGPAVNMVMTPDPTHSGLGTDIAMFGQILTKDGATTISIEKNTKDYYLSGDLERLTAKVLLTCKEGEPGLVVTGGKGWVETSEMRYTLNVTNKRTFIDRRKSDSYDVNIDPNWNLGSWVTTDNSAEGGFGPLNDHASQFESWSSGDLVYRLFNDRYSASPLAYDENKIGAGNSPDHYTAGLYCLENTAYDNMSLASSSKDNAAKVATTYAVIAVRFIPRVIVGWDLSNKYPTSKQDAVTNYLVYNSTSSEYENGTYWMRMENGTPVYYGLAGKDKMIADGKATASEFTCYRGGWSYYTTLIDGNVSGDKLTYANIDAWGVQRDHYYILAIDKISKPGSAIPGEEFIKINSITTNWVNRGSHEVEIRPTGR